MDFLVTKCCMNVFVRWMNDKKLFREMYVLRNYFVNYAKWTFIRTDEYNRISAWKTVAFANICNCSAPKFCLPLFHTSISSDNISSYCQQAETCSETIRSQSTMISKTNTIIFRLKQGWLYWLFSPKLENEYIIVSTDFCSG